LAALLERFFTQRLMQQRQASPHTISSYRDCFHQFLKFTDYAFILLAVEMDDPAKREELLQAMAHGSAAAWGHLNLLGEYDFSEDKLQDTVGIKPPKLAD